MKGDGWVAWCRRSSNCWFYNTFLSLLCDNHQTADSTILFSLCFVLFSIIIHNPTIPACQLCFALAQHYTSGTTFLSVFVGDCKALYSVSIITLVGHIEPNYLHAQLWAQWLFCLPPLKWGLAQAMKWWALKVSRWMVGGKTTLVFQ